MNSRSSYLLIGLSAAVAATSHSQSTPTSGAEVLRRMHDAYRGKWYTTLTFTQKTTRHEKDGSAAVETWRESLRHDGKTRLRIDFGDLAANNGVIYTPDSAYAVRGGKVTTQQAGGNEFLPLIEGVYVQPVEQTLREVALAKVDLTKVSAATWHGRPAWIIGAAATDSTVPQIWIDAQSLLLVRMLLDNTPGQPLLDIDLGGYVKAGGGWLATKISMTSGGKPLQTEEYSDWKVGIELPRELFEAAHWTTAPHWAKK